MEAISVSIISHQDHNQKFHLTKNIGLEQEQEDRLVKLYTQNVVIYSKLHSQVRKVLLKINAKI